MSAVDRRGDVGWSVTTEDTRGPLVSTKSTDCLTTSTVFAASVASVLGRRNGTSIPAPRARSAITGASVETRIFVIRALRVAASMVQRMSGFPPSGRQFFPGRRLEPLRAGMTASTLIGDDAAGGAGDMWLTRRAAVAMVRRYFKMTTEALSGFRSVVRPGGRVPRMGEVKSLQAT